MLICYVSLCVYALSSVQESITKKQFEHPTQKPMIEIVNVFFLIQGFLTLLLIGNLYFKEGEF